MGSLKNVRSIWLIGASSGIGLALAEELASDDRVLYLSARHRDALDELANRLPGRTVSLPLDITDKESLDGAAKIIGDQGTGLDMVIINAGTCEYIDVGDIDIAAARRVMDTNFWGALFTVSAVLPLLRTARLMRPSTRPRLVFVSSSVTYLALPRAGAYGASKAALRYFAESLRLDLQHKGIDVRVVSPGFVKTPLTDRNDFSMPFLMDADRAARCIVKGLAGSRFDIHFPGRFTRLLKTVALLPDFLRHRLLGGLSRHTRTSASAEAETGGPAGK
ncbi:MAG: SDR family NAD(P)-dependent oxidoreductase [Gammaproteobacteria bacterium]